MSFPSPPRWAYVVLALAAIAAAAFAYRALVPPQADAIVAAAGKIRQTVVVSGRVLTPATVTIGSTITGRVERVAVDEGTRVDAQQVLIELDRAELAAALKAGEAQEAAARTRIAQWRETGLPAARQALVQAEENARVAQRAADAQPRALRAGLRRARRRSTRRGARRRSPPASSRLPRRSSAACRPAAPTSACSTTSCARPSRRAKPPPRSSRRRRSARRRPAPCSTRSVEPGDIVQPGKALFTLAQDGETRLTALVDEKNLAVLRVGQTATVSADAYPADRFAAELAYIAPGIDVQRGTVETKFRVPQPPPFLRADMTVSIEIEVANRADAIVIPLPPCTTRRARRRGCWSCATAPSRGSRYGSARGRPPTRRSSTACPRGRWS